MLIGIAGKAGAGKDTLALHLVSEHNYFKVSLADPIKAALNNMFSWKFDMWDDRIWKETVQVDKGYSPRQLAQKLGTEWRDMVDPTKMMWCKAAESRFTWNSRSIGEGVIPDIRFPYEQDWIHSLGGQIVYIDRKVETVSTHVSEHSLDLSKIDFVIDNNRTPAEMFSDFDYIMDGLL